LHPSLYMSKGPFPSRPAPPLLAQLRPRIACPVRDEEAELACGDVLNPTHRILLARVDAVGVDLVGRCSGPVGRLHHPVVALLAGEMLVRVGDPPVDDLRVVHGTRRQEVRGDALVLEKPLERLVGLRAQVVTVPQHRLALFLRIYHHLCERF